MPVKKEKTVEKIPVKKKKAVEIKPVLKKKVVEIKPAPKKKVAEIKPVPKKKVAEIKPAPKKKVAEIKPVPKKKAVEIKPVPKKKVAEIKPAPKKKAVEIKPAPKKKVAEIKPVKNKKAAKATTVKKQKVAEKSLREVITDALLDKQGKDLVILDFKKIGSSICDAFIICHGASRPQVEALSDSVLENVKKKTGENPLHKEGLENAEWILIDYGDILVHIFQESIRIFYNLEQLWADAEITKIKSTN